MPDLIPHDLEADVTPEPVTVPAPAPFHPWTGLPDSPDGTIAGSVGVAMWIIAGRLNASRMPQDGQK
jgi:hypothetical protein